MCSTHLQKAKRLFYAAAVGHEDECRQLLDEGADYNAGFGLEIVGKSEAMEMNEINDDHFPCTTSFCILEVTMACLNNTLQQIVLSQVLFQHAHLSWPAVFSLILVRLTDAYVHSVGYAYSVMPFSEIDVMCCIKCITKCRECHAIQ